MNRATLYCIFIFWFSSSISFGQINYEEIKNNISDKESNTYYPALLQRFIDSDSTLTLEDFTHLYYGGVYHKGYDSTSIMEAEREIRLANYEADFLTAYELADSLLKVYPVSIQAYFEKAYACFNLKRFDEEVYNNKRYKILIKTILSSGDGKGFETAYVVNLPNDEFEVLKFLQLDYKETAELEYAGNSYNMVTLKSNKLKIKHIYFNTTKQKNIE